MKLFRRGPEFVDLFSDLSEHTVTGAGLLKGLLANLDAADRIAEKISTVEHQGDEITHLIFNELDRTFNTPFDREDIHDLGSALDDILDFIHAAAERVSIYKIHHVDPNSIALADVIVAQNRSLGDALKALRKTKVAHEHCLKVKSLERDADRLFSKLLADLFEHEKNAIELLKLKELYEVMEIACDKAKAAGDVIETIVLKKG